jgi:protein-S-isoprenylcysteine O-methyltransferase Ste14
MSVLTLIILATYAAQIIQIYFFTVPSAGSTVEMLFKVKKDPARADYHPAAAAIRSHFKMTVLILATLTVTTTSMIPLITIVYPPIFKLLVPLTAKPSALMKTTSILLLVSGNVLTYVAVVTLRSHVSFHPFGETTRLHTSGIYASSRNPITVGLTLIYAGFFLALPSAIMLFGFIVFLLNSTYRVKMEETYLQRAFGEDYLQYRRQVRKYIPPTGGFILSAGFLNVLMNIQYPATGLPLGTLFKPSPEAFTIMLIIWLTAILRIRFQAAVYVPLTALTIFLRLFRLGDILVPMYFFRPFNLYLDSRFVPDLLHLLYTTMTREAFFFWIIAAAALLVATTWLLWLSFKTLFNYLEMPRIRSWIVGIVMVSVVVLPQIPNGILFDHDRLFSRSFSPRVIEEFDFILQIKGIRAKHSAVIESALQKNRTTPSSLDKLNGADVYLFFIESYGHTIFGDIRHFPKIKPDLVALEKMLNEQGFEVVSNFFDSPTYGGSSWLAHATLASGVHINNQMRDNLLITSQVKTLARYFNAAGYRTVRAMPGTQWPWPEGEFYGYQAKYYAWHFDYQGPMYGWSTMPDQYVLDFIRRREMETTNQPLFIEFILVSSHAPFHRQPPYLEDWSRINNGAIYHDLNTVTFPIVWPDLTNASEGYVSAIRYDLTVITAFIRQYIRKDALIVILGDHQPNVQLTGKHQPWLVPVHVISRNAELLNPFQERGFQPGLIPEQPPPYHGMDSFLFDFLADFSTADN